MNINATVTMKKSFYVVCTLKLVKATGCVIRIEEIWYISALCEIFENFFVRNNYHTLELISYDLIQIQTFV